MSKTFFTWIASALAAALLLAMAASLDAQAPAESTSTEATAPAEVDMEALLALDREARFEALRGMERDRRIVALNQLSRQERRAFRAHGKSVDSSLATTPGYQPLVEPRPVEVRPTKVAGTTIQYDSGVATGFITLIDSGRAALNRYDSALNGAGTALVPVEQSGTITRISFEMLLTSGSTVTWSLYSDIVGTSARQVTSRIIPAAVGLNSHTVDPMVTNNAYQNGEFLAGLWQFNVGFTRVAADNNNAGQGFHAYSIDDPSTGTERGRGLRALGNRNFIFRISGNLVTPIELRNFEIE